MSVKYIDKEKRCDINSNKFESDKTLDWDILIHPIKQKYKGYWCSVVKSTKIIRCGIWSYNQILTVPDSEIQVHVSSADCQAMVQESIFRTPDGKEVKLNRKRENVFKFTLGGELHAEEDKTNYCQGTDLKVDTGIIGNAIILEQVKVNVFPTDILAEVNQRLISERDMSYLPSECKSQHTFCYRQVGTYIWDSKKFQRKCDFEFYKMGQFVRVEPHTFVDGHNKLIIRFESNGHGQVVTCNGQVVMQTLEGFWVTERKQNSVWSWKK